jgi:ribonuclease BN (tRNA processing enzyme)
MADYFELDFLPVETKRSGDAICIRYSIGGQTRVHVVDGGFIDTGDQIVSHLKTFYETTKVDNVVLTHSDQDHANGLRKVLEDCTVSSLWMNRPWLYADELIGRFETYNSVDHLRRKLREIYSGPAALEEIAIKKGIPIREAFQGAQIGEFTVMTPTKARYLDLIVESNKTPGAAQQKALDGIVEAMIKGIKTAAALVKAAWGAEYFPVEGTSAENEMSLVQYANISEKAILLTGDTGRQGLAEAADYAPYVGLALPGIDAFQVPHHGGRHNVDTSILNRWLGKPLPGMPTTTTWNAICSSAKEDEDHPKRSVKRAMLHRGAHFSETEGKVVNLTVGKDRRPGWSSIPQAEYPPEQEE